MARGKKYGEELRERARALLAVSNSVEEVARKLGLPRSTVDTWRRSFERDEDAEQNLVVLRQKKKEEFIRSAWRTIGNAQRILERRTERALQDEERIDLLLSTLCAEAASGEPSKELLRQLQELKLCDVGKLSTVVGTLFDKQALAAREPTEILGGEVALRRFEDIE